MRKITALTLIVLLLGTSCPAWAATPGEDLDNVAKSAVGEVRELSLEECLKLAEENNESIKLAESSLEQAKVSLKQAAEQDKKLRRADRISTVRDN